MNGNFLDGLMSKVEQAAPIGVGIYALLQDPMQASGGLNNATINFMLDRISHWKLPSDVIGMYKWALSSGAYSSIPNGILAAIVGWVAKQLNLHPIVNRIGSIAEKAGTASAIGGLIAATIWLPATTGSPPDPSKFTGNSFGGNFANAPTMNQAVATYGY